MEDPESLLNVWLEELDTLTVGLDNGVSRPTQMTSDLNTPRIDSYRFSMANLEESLDVDLDAILGELCALESKCDEELAGARNSKRDSRQSETTRSRLDIGEDHGGGKTESVGRTDSPDNDSAFSDNVSLLSSESSASSGGSSGASKTSSGLGIDPQNEAAHRVKSEKIRIALEKMKQAAVKKLFIKAFMNDGSTKSLMVDEKMTCNFVTRLLADKNHVTMDPKWGLVEHLPELYMERVYEEHELLVENLMLWTRDSPNTLLFHERPEKYQLFHNPEKFLLSSDDGGCDHDSHSRAMLLEEFFSHSHVPEISGPLFLKTDSRKCWKRYHFVLRASGLYYYPKEKSKSLKDLSCLASFDVNQVYYGVGWRKKYKAPSDFCFAIKHPRLQQSKSSKYIKYLCAEDNATLQRWVVGIRIAKYGRQIFNNYRALLDDMAQEDLDKLAHARSCSTASIAQAAEARELQCLGNGNPESHRRDSVVSRASSSSSSGCHSDGVSGSETGFLSDYPYGTIKRKPPSIQPKLPLTSMTRQLIESGESAENGTLTRRSSWRRSQTADEPSNQSTLTRGRSLRAQLSTEEPGNQSTLTRRRSMKEGSRAGSNESTLTRPRLVKDPNNALSEASRTLQETVNSLLVHTSDPVPEPDFEEVMERDLETMSNHSSSFGEEDKEHEQDLPPPPEMFDSTLSLDSLPPPPSQSELPIFDSELSCSSLSLASLPPFPQPASPPSPKSDLSTPVSSGEATPTNGTPTRSPAARAFDFSHARNESPNSGEVTPTNGSLTRNGAVSANATPTNSPLPRGSSFRGFDFKSNDPTKHQPIVQTTSGVKAPYYPPTSNSNYKPVLPPSSAKPTDQRVSFLPQQTPRLPPVGPRRVSFASPPAPATPTKLSPPHTDFLKDLQRVMRKKWQVAQKCAAEPTVSPHEVLGFRDPPQSKEAHVSNWVNQHYGLYENVYVPGSAASSTTAATAAPQTALSKKRPPPPPPKRSETTQLTTRMY